MFSLAVGREGHCERISLASVGRAHSDSATLGLPLLTACVPSQATLLRLQVALLGTVRRALGCMYFPGQVQVLRYSTKAQTRLGLRFVPFPGVSSSGDQVLGERTLPSWAVCLITSHVPAAQFPG